MFHHPQRVMSSSSAASSSSSSSSSSSFKNNQRRYRAFSSTSSRVRTDRRTSGAAAATSEGNDKDNIPPNCTRVSVEVKKPLGLILEEDGLGGIRVAEVIEEGNCAKTKLIQAGDKILAISAEIKTRTQDYGGVSVGSGEEMIRLQVQGEKFDTIMAAISSYPSQKTMKIDVLKCQD
jgi:hypothetical protein|tara:strand:+ start:420 stop:950 length:531 start_codon:yes stop_codon:yes gene_type:complete|mmetsp:Transcript_5016/g.14929  ORF Transcript_5016/g.14929 Transcript_5016/m.14929 type:complete len:177 (+) Transcript_5016:107-637(+)